MITFKKTFDFYATDEEMDTFVYSILEGPGCDPEDDIVVMPKLLKEVLSIDLKILDLR